MRVDKERGEKGERQKRMSTGTTGYDSGDVQTPMRLRPTESTCWQAAEAEGREALLEYDAHIVLKKG